MFKITKNQKEKEMLENVKEKLAFDGWCVDDSKKEIMFIPIGIIRSEGKVEAVLCPSKELMK